MSDYYYKKDFRVSSIVNIFINTVRIFLTCEIIIIVETVYSMLNYITNV